MDTRREFFQKIRVALVGGAGIAAGIAALPEKKPIGEAWTGFVPAKDQTFRGIPIVRKHYDGPDQIVCSKAMYDYLKSTGRF